MRFYKVEGIVPEVSEGSQSTRLSSRDDVRCAAMRGDRFNQGLNGQTFFFISGGLEEGTRNVRLGIITLDSCVISELLTGYLETVGLPLTEFTVEEITLRQLRFLLHIADRNGYIMDADEVLNTFGLEQLVRRGIDYGENLLCAASKAECRAAAKKYLVQDSLLPELDRIWQGGTRAKVSGHPVHYMVFSDDRDIRKGTYQTLLRALYTNGRIRNRRYCFVDFRLGGDFSEAVYDSLYRSCEDGVVVVRYLAADDSESIYASAERETIQMLCKVMMKYRNLVLTVFCLPRGCNRSKEIFYEYLGNTGIVELSETPAQGEQAAAFLKSLARENCVRSDKKLLTRIEPDCAYLAPELRATFDDWFAAKLKTSVYPQYAEIGSAKKEAVKAKPKGTAYEELQDMIGLTEAKTVIQQALDYFKVQRLYRESGMAEEHPAMHMVFTGNPGTAKTTVARIFARIMRENDLLSRGHLVEVGRSDLVGKYVGWTANIIKEKFKAAEGGVLFIDEAYSLVDDRSGSYGDEAINTIVQEMENHRKDTVVIFAGYPEPMETFLNRNPGLRSRIAFHVPFADYSAEELCDITRLMGKQKKLQFTDDAMEKLSRAFESARSRDDFGNGRYVRNLLEHARMRQATRILQLDSDAVTPKTLRTICAEDIEIPQIAAKRTCCIGFAG